MRKRTLHFCLISVVNRKRSGNEYGLALPLVKALNGVPYTTGLDPDMQIRDSGSGLDASHVVPRTFCEEHESTSRRANGLAFIKGSDSVRQVLEQETGKHKSCRPIFFIEHLQCL